jgi:hypothetical protein
MKRELKEIATIYLSGLIYVLIYFIFEKIHEGSGGYFMAFALGERTMIIRFDLKNAGIIK